MSSINIPAILIANIMGITLLFVVAAGNSWQTRKIFRENKGIKIIFYSCIASCIADPISFLADGKPGLFFFFLVFGCNTWLFIGNLINSLMWIKLIIDRMDIKIPVAHKFILFLGSTINGSLLIVNLIVPTVFYVDKNNVYNRTTLYWVYTGYYLLVLLYGLVLYFIERYKSGKLKFFPVWAFIVPIILGMVIQSLHYGVSTITPFLTVSLICMILGFQNEFLYRDKLTGLYNRFFLEIVDKKITEKAKHQYTAMMLDLNNFKNINDQYGHKVGDEALIQASSILKKVVGPIGEVIRYAGDEFIIVLNTQDDATIQMTIDQIHQTFADFSNEENAPYELSVSLGYYKVRTGADSLDELLNKIDKLMYDNKREYYQTHLKHNRRRN